ncbi:MAG TPA: NAD-dependent malic enzyme [Candidatus Atribacteria bacterium]|nr:NAD-dependent malic enzyme [Candidatus Atribacteria bacterium]
MSCKERALKLHEELKGKLEIISKKKIKTKEDLSITYTPGVAYPCLEIEKDPNLAYRYTGKGNLIAVVTDGSAVLGLGNIGALAGMPVMEGKCVLFKEFGGIDAFPIMLSTQDPDEIVETVVRIAPGFGGINLEDISAPKCFYIEQEIQKRVNIPIFHDDQHGTAIVTLSGLINAVKIVDKKMENLKVVINGAGSAGIAIAKILISSGIEDIVIVDRRGIIYDGREGLNEAKKEIAKITNKKSIKGGLKEAVKGRDLFIGVSAKDVLTPEMIKSMAKDPIVFAMANPDPEINPELAKKAGARIVATGRSDYPNQINNVLAFPGVFRGALDAKAKAINEEMKKGAAYAIASIITQEELKEDYIIPDPFNKEVVKRVAKAVYETAIKTGITNKD